MGWVTSSFLMVIASLHKKPLWEDVQGWNCETEGKHESSFYFFFYVSTEINIYVYKFMETLIPKKVGMLFKI